MSKVHKRFRGSQFIIYKVAKPKDGAPSTLQILSSFQKSVETASIFACWRNKPTVAIAFPNTTMASQQASSSNMDGNKLERKISQKVYIIWHLRQPYVIFRMVAKYS